MSDETPLHRLHWRSLNHRVLSAEEETQLLDLATQGDQDAIEKLVKTNQRLIVSVAYRYFTSGMTGDNGIWDLIQLGNIGLLKAIEKWDPKKGKRLSTYAVPWIRAFIRRNGMTSGTTIGRTARESELLFYISKAENHLTSQIQRPITDQEIAEHTGISERLVTDLRGMLNTTFSIDHRQDGQENNLAETIPDETDTAQDADAILMAGTLRENLKLLPKPFRLVLIWRYELDEKPQLTYAEIAKRLGISRQRAVQIEAQALRRLRRLLS